MKPMLVKVGKHYIDPTEVACIKKAKPGLYLVKLRSEPNPEWPIWIKARHIAALLDQFEIQTSDGDDDDEDDTADHD